MNKKALIQLNLATGVGDQLTDFVSCVEMAGYLNSISYETHLIISLHGHNYPDGPNIFKQVFKDEIFSVFKSVKEMPDPISNLIYEDLNYYNEPGCEYARPGVHHWDIFFNIVPEILKISRYSSSSIYANRLNIYPFALTLTEKFESKLISYVNSLPKNWEFLHVRTSDTSVENQQRVVKHLSNYLDSVKAPICVGGNDQFLIQELAKIKNLYTYTYFLENICKHSKIEFNVNTQTKNFLNIFTEMAGIKYANKIHCYNEYTWISNFLFYGLAENKELNINIVPHLT